MLSLADIGQKISNSNVQMFISILNDAAVLFCLSSSAMMKTSSAMMKTIVVLLYDHNCPLFVIELLVKAPLRVLYDKIQ